MAITIQDEGTLKTLAKVDEDCLCSLAETDEDHLCVIAIIDEDCLCTSFGTTTAVFFRADTTILLADRDTMSADYSY